MFPRSLAAFPLIEMRVLHVFANKKVRMALGIVEPARDAANDSGDGDRSIGQAFGTEETLLGE